MVRATEFRTAQPTAIRCRPFDKADIIKRHPMTPRPNVNGVPIPHGRSLAELVQLLDAHRQERWAAFDAVARTPGRESLNALRARTHSDDAYVRRAAIAAIGMHELGREAAEIVRAALADPSPYVVRTACDVLGEWHDVAAHTAIVRLLASPDSATRIKAIAALAGIWQPADFEPVTRAMLHDADDEVRKQAAYTLRANATRETWERLFELWVTDLLARHRQWACEIAAAFGDRKVLPELDILSRDPDGHVRSAAGRANRAVIERAGG